jgi:hypothetical protein
MHNSRLADMQKDLEDTAAHLEALTALLQGHAMFLRNKKYGDQSEDLLLVERSLGGLTTSVHDLRGTALNMSQVA